MSAGIYNFTLNQGATFTRQMTVKENNSPLNLTGHTAAMQLRSTYDSSTVALSMTAAVINATQGILSISATATATAALEEGIYVYDLELTTSAGVVTRLLQGQVTVSPEVTR
tara:strand:- start:1210 stop:1545 length:336 start_codon:yes stop_codon:yes gene_type:complete